GRWSLKAAGPPTARSARSTEVASGSCPQVLGYLSAPMSPGRRTGPAIEGSPITPQELLCGSGITPRGSNHGAREGCDRRVVSPRRRADDPGPPRGPRLFPEL